MFDFFYRSTHFFQFLFIIFFILFLKLLLYLLLGIYHEIFFMYIYLVRLLFY